MGTATFSVALSGVAGNVRMVAGTVTMSASYAANGDTLPASALGLSEVFAALPEDGTNTILLRYDRANGKMLAFFPTGGATTAPTTLAAPIVTTGAASATAVDATTPNITPGIMKQVAATANLGTTTGRFVFFGV